MATENTASYFPVTITGGTTNPMVGADLVQGANPQDLGLDSILTAIQSQYTPQTFTHSGGSYGAQRFINLPDDFDGVYPSVTAGNVATPWYTPTEFNLDDYQTTLSPELSKQIATGGVYGGDSYSPVSNVGNEAWMSDPYAGLDPLTGLRSGVNALIPGAGLLIGAAQGYAGATSANTLNDVLNYLGDEGLGTVDPAKAAVLGAFGITPQTLKDAQEFYAIFDQNPATMLNWAAYPVDTASNQIVDFMMEGAQNPLSPQDIGVMSWAVRADIDQAVVAGKSLTDAVRDVAISKGVNPTQAAEMGVAASRSAVTQGLQKGLSLEDMDPAAVAVYNDPLGALIDALGITGRIDASIDTALGALDYATPDDISEALAGLNFATAEDIATALSGLDYSTPDDISEALASLNIPTLDDIISAIATPVTETPLQPTTELPPAGEIVDDFFNIPEGVETIVDFVTYILTPTEGGVTPTEQDVADVLDSLPDLTAEERDQILANVSSFVQPSGGQFFLADSQGNYVTEAGQIYQAARDSLQASGSGDTLTSPIVGGPISVFVPTPTPLPPAGGSIIDFGGGGGGDYSSYSGAGESQTAASLSGASDLYG